MPHLGVLAEQSTGIPKVCIVTATHIAHDPRLVKEADALSRAGYDVRVISCQLAPWIAARDEGVMRRRSWRHDPVRALPCDAAGRWRTIVSYVRMQLFRHTLARVSLQGGIAERALGRLHPELVRAACHEPANLFVAHNLEALPAAREAARRFGARLGFDAEDLHIGEFGEAERGGLRCRLVEEVEAAHIGACDYVSAPSPEVAEALERQYPIPRPVVLYNVFPWADRQHLDGLFKDRREPGLSLYWYSQTIGPGRGIEDVIRACGLLDGPLHLHLRGAVSDTDRRRLLALAQTSGTGRRLHFHEPVPPEELLSRAAEHDVGLALESPVTESRRLSVTNKLFVYLLAGLGVAATDVPGQRTVMDSCGGAGFIYRPGDAQALAGGLRAWLDDPQRLARARRAALDAARQRWNWEAESRVLLTTVQRLIGSPESQVGLLATP